MKTETDANTVTHPEGAGAELHAPAGERRDDPGVAIVDESGVSLAHGTGR